MLSGFPRRCFSNQPSSGVNGMVASLISGNLHSPLWHSDAVLGRGDHPIREGANKWIAPSPRALCPHLKCPSLQKPDFLPQVFGY